jgi:hypothetical protein
MRVKRGDAGLAVSSKEAAGWLGVAAFTVFSPVYWGEKQHIFSVDAVPLA